MTNDEKKKTPAAPLKSLSVEELKQVNGGARKWQAGQNPIGIV